MCIRDSRAYGAKTADESASDRLELALVTPGASGEFPVALAIGPEKKGGGIGHRIAPFKVSVPLSVFTFLDEGGRRKAVVEVTLAAVEARKGNMRFVATVRDVATNRIGVGSASVRVE